MMKLVSCIRRALKRSAWLLFFLLTATVVQAQTFSVAVTPQALTVYPGEGQVPVTVSVTSSTYAGPVTITLSGLPSDISIASLPLTLTPGSTGTILLQVGVHADQEAFPASLGAPNTALTGVKVIGAVGSVQAASTLNLTVSLTNPGFAPASGQINLPMVNINTNGTAISNGTTEVPGTLTITSADGSVTYLPSSSASDNLATFHLHGNTTAQMPKKPYHVKLDASTDLLTLMGLACPYITSSGKAVCDKSKSYDLLANYDDKTSLRDWAASALANAIPYGGAYLNESAVPSSDTGVIPTPSGTATLLPWAPHSLFVELYVNGAYEGVYQLIEQVKLDSHRVNAASLEETDTTHMSQAGTFWRSISIRMKPSSSPRRRTFLSVSSIPILPRIRRCPRRPATSRTT